MPKPSTNPTKVATALADLQARIARGQEYPDAQYAAASRHNVDPDALADAYDEADRQREQERQQQRREQADHRAAKPTILFKWHDSRKAPHPDDREQAARIIRSFRRGQRAGERVAVTYHRATHAITVLHTDTGVGATWTRA